MIYYGEFTRNFSTTEASDLLQKLNLDPKTKTHDAAEVTNKVYYACLDLLE